ncbi:MAG: phage antirepressor protein [Vampirovibrionales bacterium]
MTTQNNSLKLFQDQHVRTTWHNDQWYFAVVDVVAVLTGSVNPTDYIKKLRKRDEELAKGWG